MVRIGLLVGAVMLALSACTGADGPGHQSPSESITLGGDPESSAVDRGPVSRCTDVPPIPTHVEVNTVLDPEGGQLEWDYIDPEPPHETRTFVIDFVNDPSCRLRDDTFNLINHALAAAELPALKRYPVKITRCADVRLPKGGLGEADFNVDAALGLLDINFSDTRDGEYRNISYTVRYVGDPSCPTTPAMSDVISRVDPPGWTGQDSQLVPADQQQPTHGACARSTGPLVTIKTNPDTPAPICTTVHPHQKLRVVNTSDRFGFDGIPVTVAFADFRTRTLDLGESTIFDSRFGQFLAPGVHMVRISLYGGRGAEIWLTNLR